MGQAVLESRLSENSDTDILTFKTSEPLGFVGGQYIIIDSKIPFENGKNYKRAYTIFSSEKKQNEFSIAYKKLKGGVVTNQYLNLLEKGEELIFSGPWGKFLKEDRFAEKGKVLILVTDTGISTALGFLSSAKIRNRLKDVALRWYVPSEQYFISQERLNEYESQLGDFKIIQSSEYKVDRKDEFYNEVQQFLNLSSYDSYFLSGDGRVVKEGRETLLKRGVSSAQIGTKIYFNKEGI